MLTRMRGMVVSAGSNASTADNFARIAYNLPLLLAFDAMRGALLAARNAGHFSCGNDDLGPLMDAAKARSLGSTGRRSVMASGVEIA
jgi:hypothetical protein